MDRFYFFGSCHFFVFIDLRPNALFLYFVNKYNALSFRSQIVFLRWVNFDIYAYFLTNFPLSAMLKALPLINFPFWQSKSPRPQCFHQQNFSFLLIYNQYTRNRNKIMAPRNDIRLYLIESYGGGKL